MAPSPLEKGEIWVRLPVTHAPSGEAKSLNPLGNNFTQTALRPHPPALSAQAPHWLQPECGACACLEGVLE
jgi:hypothetical protein